MEAHRAVFCKLLRDRCLLILGSYTIHRIGINHLWERMAKDYPGCDDYHMCSAAKDATAWAGWGEGLGDIATPCHRVYGLIRPRRW